MASPRTGNQTEGEAFDFDVSTAGKAFGFDVSTANYGYGGYGGHATPRTILPPPW